MSKIEPVNGSHPNPASLSPPPLRIINRGPLLLFYHLIYPRRCGGGFQYLVDLEGGGPDKRSLVSALHIKDSSPVTCHPASTALPIRDVASRSKDKAFLEDEVTTRPWRRIKPSFHPRVRYWFWDIGSHPLGRVGFCHHHIVVT